MPAKILFTDIETTEIINRYVNGAPLRYLANEYDVDPCVIKRIVQSRNVQLRSYSENNTRYNKNPNLFDCDTEEGAYWTGFIAADGCIMGERNTISLNLNKLDYTHLLKYQLYIGMEIPILSYKDSRYIRLTDHLAVERLIENGITKNKTFTLTISDKIKNNRHFWRGFIDGDGCWCFDSRTDNLLFKIMVGSPCIVEQLYSFCVSIGIQSKAKPILSKGKYPSLYYSGKWAKVLAHTLYDNNIISLTRKEERATRGVNHG